MLLISRLLRRNQIIQSNSIKSRDCQLFAESTLNFFGRVDPENLLNSSVCIRMEKDTINFRSQMQQSKEEHRGIEIEEAELIQMSQSDRARITDGIQEVNENEYESSNDYENEDENNDENNDENDDENENENEIESNDAPSSSAMLNFLSSGFDFSENEEHSSSLLNSQECSMANKNKLVEKKDYSQYYQKKKSEDEKKIEKVKRIKQKRIEYSERVKVRNSLAWSLLSEDEKEIQKLQRKSKIEESEKVRFFMIFLYFIFH